MATSSSNIGSTPIPQPEGSISSGKSYKPARAIRIILPSLRAETTDLNVVPDSAESEPLDGTSITIDNQSATRMLEEYNLNINRVELIGMLDFKGLNNTFSAADSSVSTLDLFNMRTQLRAADIQAVQQSINQISAQSSEAFTQALQQYEAAVGSTQAEMSLLKLAYIMKQYAYLTCDFSSFLKLYEYPDAVFKSQIGEDADDFFSNILKIEPANDLEYFDYGTIPFIQLLMDLGFMIRYASPTILDCGVRNIDDLTIDRNYPTDFNKDWRYSVIKISRVFTASHEFMKIISGEDPNTELEKAFNENSDISSWLKNLDTPDFTLYRLLNGISLPKQNNTNLTSRWIEGVSSGLVDKINADGKMFLETRDATLPFGSRSKTYGTIHSYINQAFTQDHLLDFGDFEEITSNISSGCKDFSLIYKSAFRLLDYKDPQPRDGYRILEDEQPLSPASLYAVVLKFLNERFIKKAYDAIYTNGFGMGDYSSDAETQTRYDYRKIQSYVFLKENPRRAKLILKAFISDYYSGFLTAVALPEEMEDGTFSEPTNVDPITNSPVTLTGQSQLQSVLGNKMLDWIKGQQQVTDVSIDDYTGDTPGTIQVKDRDCYYTMEGLHTRRWLWYREKVAPPEDRIGKKRKSVKPIAAEIISCVMGILREYMGAVVDIEPVPDGDPVWPIFSDGAKHPYNSSEWGFTAKSSLGAEDNDYWIPTIQAFNDNFCRGGTQETIQGSMEINGVLFRIVDILAEILQNHFDWLEFKQFSYETTTDDGEGIVDWYAVVAQKGATTNSQALEVYGQLFTTFGVNASQVFNCPSPNHLQTVDFKVRGNVGPWTTGNAFISRWTGFTSSMVNDFLDLFKEDSSLGIGLDIFEKFGNRIDAYSQATLATLSQNEDEATGSVHDYITSIVSSGNAGVDILENLTPQQFILRRKSFDRQQASTDGSYMARTAEIDQGEQTALLVLMENIKLIGSEGRNVRSFFVGLPAGMIDNLKIKGKFAIQVNNVDIEYNNIVFKPKYFRYDSRLAVFNGDISIPPGVFPNSMKDLLGLISFRMVTWIMDQSGDNTSALNIEEKIEKVRWSDITHPDDIDIYANHLIDHLLQNYYSLMLGMSLNEDTFPSTGGKMGMPINAYAGDLQNAVDSFYSGIAGIGGQGTDMANIGLTASSILDDFSSIIEVGDSAGRQFTNLDMANLVNFRNTATTRLLTGEGMRDLIIKAKIFERTFLLFVDPDEFEIATSSNTGADEPFTSQDVFDRYLEQEIIEKFQKPDGTWGYKLVPRVHKEGEMTFNKIIFSIASAPALGDHQVDLS